VSKQEHALSKIVNLCANRGFIYPGSDIYGGLPMLLVLRQ